ncbi:hypothetical protein LWI29_000982 [Acer saccharum]|uniref:Uncharacterized protein n=1 Tax=Acer saccharum TaxID=4024 RepID=A0AA39W5E5_ACESA|nr:hypothetical protein LWI29_000982 [Acer saccharum]
MLNNPKERILRLNGKSISSMSNLMLLKLNNVDVSEDQIYLSNSLRFFKWHGCPLKNLPSNFEAQNLFELNLCRSQIKYLWTGEKAFSKLKTIKLSNSHNLIETPNFTKVPNLEMLDLKEKKAAHGGNEEVHNESWVNRNRLVLAGGNVVTSKQRDNEDGGKIVASSSKRGEVVVVLEHVEVKNLYDSAGGTNPCLRMSRELEAVQMEGLKESNENLTEALSSEERVNIKGDLQKNVALSPGKVSVLAKKKKKIHRRRRRRKSEEEEDIP